MTIEQVSNLFKLEIETKRGASKFHKFINLS